MTSSPTLGSAPTHRGRDWAWSAALVLAAHAALLGAAPAPIAPIAPIAPPAPARAQAPLPLVTVSSRSGVTAAEALPAPAAQVAGKPLATASPVSPAPVQGSSATRGQASAQSAAQATAQATGQATGQATVQTTAPALASTTASTAPPPTTPTAGPTATPATEAPRPVAAVALTPPTGAPPLAAPGAVAPAPEIPTYATRFAPALRLAYDMRRGAVSGSAELAWQPAGDGYTLALKTRVLGAEVFGLASRGSFDAAGLAPQRFTDSRRGRDRQAANFERAAGRISYSGPSVTQPLPAGSQDRLSWMVQLPAIVEADPARWRPGARLELFVSGARGDADVWTFVVQGRESLSVGGAPVADALRLTREPRKPYDTQVEVWLDPARHHLPVRARMTVQPGGETLDLRLTGWAPAG